MRGFNPKRWPAVALTLVLLLGGAMAARAQPAATVQPVQPSSTVPVPATVPPGPAVLPSAAGPIVVPPQFVTPPEPQPGDTNAQRARSQPGNNAPFWRGVQQSGTDPGFTTLPGAEKGVLIQRFVQYPGSQFTTAGEAWRQVRNDWIIPYGSALLLITALAIAIFFWTKGPMETHSQPTGRKIERFTPLERATHWSVAIAFVILAVSGIVMAFGRFFLLPVLGGALFGWLTYALKNLHNFAGPLFAVGLVLMVVLFIADNIPKKHDVRWVREGGGMIGDKHPPAGRFNAGEKFVFWGGVILLGFVVVGSGLVLDKLIPGLGETRGDMQVAHMVHAIASMLMMAMFMGHIYLGTVGTDGAYRAMRHGYVDEAWAHDHHRLWYDDVKSGKVPAQRSGGTPPGPVARAERPA